MSKYGHLPINWFEAIVNKLGGEDGAERFLRDKLQVCEPTPSWREEGGVIYFSVTSDGTTGEGWITRLESKGFLVGCPAKQVLRSGDFKPTNGVTTEVAVLKGMFFEDNDRVMSEIRAEADKRKFGKSEPELACLIREKFTGKEIEVMGLSHIVAMHEPINDSDGVPSLLGMSRYGDGSCFGYSARPDRRWDRCHGFAFTVSQACFLCGRQVGSQS